MKRINWCWTQNISANIKLQKTCKKTSKTELIMPINKPFKISYKNIFLISPQFSRATIMLFMFQPSKFWTKYTKVINKSAKIKKNLWIGSYLKWSKYLPGFCKFLLKTYFLRVGLWLNFLSAYYLGNKQNFIFSYFGNLL